jgi:hypothetical protein
MIPTLRAACILSSSPVNASFSPLNLSLPPVHCSLSPFNFSTAAANAWICRTLSAKIASSRFRSAFASASST